MGSELLVQRGVAHVLGNECKWYGIVGDDERVAEVRDGVERPAVLHLLHALPVAVPDVHDASVIVPAEAARVA